MKAITIQTLKLATCLIALIAIALFIAVWVSLIISSPFNGDADGTLFWSYYAVPAYVPVVVAGVLFIVVGLWFVIFLVELVALKSDNKTKGEAQ